MEQISKNIKNPIHCSGCQKAIAEDEEQYPIARHKYICQSCYDTCGFGNHTATNCLSEDDVKYMLALKKEYPEEGPIVEYPYLDATTTGPDSSSEIDNITSDSCPEILRTSTSAPESLENENCKAEDENALNPVVAVQGDPDEVSPLLEPELDVEKDLRENDTYNPELAYSSVNQSNIEGNEEVADGNAKKKKLGFASIKGILPRKEEPLADVGTPQPPETSSVPVSKGISARKYEESRDRIEDDYEEEIDPQQRKRNIIKIVGIIAVTLITLLIVGSFLPISAFSQKEDVSSFTIIQGEENPYSQKPLVPKDGYIYNIPAGSYKVTMSSESTAAKGVVTIEGNTVLPSPDSKGYYENLETIELTPGESAAITVVEGQHIYTSINTIFTFEQQ